MDIQVLEEGIALVRAHKEIGRGSCSRIDECFSDIEIKEYLEMLEKYVRCIDTPEKVLIAMLDYENLLYDVEQDIKGL